MVLTSRPHLSATERGKRESNTGDAGPACWAIAGEKSGGAGDWAAAGRWAEQLLGHGKARPEEREEEEFLFFNFIFKSKYKSNLNPFGILIKPKHHKNKYASA